VYRNTTNNPNGSSQIGSTSNLLLDDTSAYLGTLYYYWVKAHNIKGDSAFSSGDTGWIAVSAPINVQATDGTYANKVQITWSGSIGATGYKVFRNTTSTPPPSPIGTSASSSYDDTGATPGEFYYYWIKAYDNNGDSALSNYNSGWRKGDDTALEVGGYWVSQYSHENHLDNTDERTTGFLNILNSNGWSVVFNKGDEAPLASVDFDDTGKRNNSPDGVDIFWFDGHGASGALVLIADWPPLYDRVYSANIDWGDNDVEWIFLHACETLKDDDTGSDAWTPGSKTGKNFARSLNGCHMICGAHTVMYDDCYEEGQNVANRLVDSDSGGPDIALNVRTSWFEGIDETMGNYVTLRIVAEDSSYWDEYIWGQGSGPASEATVDNYYYSWTYTCS
jgi:hypothetical protein